MPTSLPPFSRSELDDIEESENGDIGGSGFLPSGLRRNASGPTRKAPSRENSLGDVDAFSKMFAQYDKIVDSMSSLMTTSTEDSGESCMSILTEDYDSDDEGEERLPSSKKECSPQNKQNQTSLMDVATLKRKVSRKSSKEEQFKRGLRRHDSRDGPLMRQVARSLSGEEGPRLIPARRPGLKKEGQSCMALRQSASTAPPRRGLSKGGKSCLLMDVGEKSSRPNNLMRKGSSFHALMERKGSFRVKDFFKAFEEDEIALSTGW